MATVIKDATVVTCDDRRTIWYGAAIAVEADRIAAVGPSEEVSAQFPGAEVVDGRGKAVLPGLINAHTHLLATVDRGILEDFGFPTTLRFPVTARSLLTTEEKNVMGLLGAVEAIRSGTTALLEISSDVAHYAESLEETGLRLVLAENINDVDEARAREGIFEFLSDKLEGGLQLSADLI